VTRRPRIHTFLEAGSSFFSSAASGARFLEAALLAAFFLGGATGVGFEAMRELLREPSVGAEVFLGGIGRRDEQLEFHRGQGTTEMLEKCFTARHGIPRK
jgi:hypothetical protein